MNAWRVYLLYTAALSLAFGLSFTVNMFYWVDTVGLNPFQMVLIGTALEGSIFLFEIPTGIVADVYSRRLSIIIGVFLIGVGMAMNAISIFPVILLGQAVWGFGYTFTSGAVDAWITDEIGEDKAGQAFLQAAQVGRGVGIGTIIMSVALASISIYIPLLMSGVVCALLGLFLMVAMPETGFTPIPRTDRTTWQSMKDTFQDGVKVVRSHHFLALILLITVMHGSFTESYDRLWTAHLLDQFSLPSIGEFQPVVWFGIIGMVSSMIAIGLQEVVRRYVDTADYTALVRGLMVANGVILVSVMLFALAGYFWQALIMLWVIDIARSIAHPLQQAWINQGLDSSVRATILSMNGQADALGQIGGGPALGLVANTFSIRLTLMLGSLLLLPVLWLLRVVLRRGAILKAQMG